VTSHAKARMPSLSNPTHKTQKGTPTRGRARTWTEYTPQPARPERSSVRASKDAQIDAPARTPAEVHYRDAGQLRVLSSARAGDLSPRCEFVSQHAEVRAREQSRIDPVPLCPCRPPAQWIATTVQAGSDSSRGHVDALGGGPAGGDGSGPSVCTGYVRPPRISFTSAHVAGSTTPGGECFRIDDGLFEDVKKEGENLDIDWQPVPLKCYVARASRYRHLDRLSPVCHHIAGPAHGRGLPSTATGECFYTIMATSPSAPVLATCFALIR
jgi:hypothetical protein